MIHQVATLAGRHPAKALAKRLPQRAWNRLSAGVGAKGQRWYDWALIDIPNAELPGRCGRSGVVGPPIDQQR
jgi:hypothetical protein